MLYLLFLLGVVVVAFVVDVVVVIVVVVVALFVVTDHITLGSTNVHLGLLKANVEFVWVGV